MTLDQLLAEVEKAIEAATRGPWQVVETKHPWHLSQSPIVGIPAFEGKNHPERKGEHIERRIFTTWDHPQMKAPDHVVTGASCVGMEPGKPIHIVEISRENAEYIALVNPANMRLILDAITADREARERTERDEPGAYPNITDIAEANYRAKDAVRRAEAAEARLKEAEKVIALYRDALAAAPSKQEGDIPEFKPCVIVYQDSGISEMLLEDCPTITGEEMTVRPLRRMDEDRAARDIVGFQWETASGQSKQEGVDK